MSEVKNKRTIIHEAIVAGGATKESLMEVASVNAAGLASQLTYLRLTGIYPMVGEDGVYFIGTEEEWNEHKTNKTGKPKEELTPEGMREKLEKKAARAASAETNASKKAKDNKGDKILQLKAKRAALDLEICERELGAHQAEYPDLEDASSEPEEVGGGDESGADELM